MGGERSRGGGECWGERQGGVLLESIIFRWMTASLVSSHFGMVDVKNSII